ncbi:LacI family DNA-binding transcriptional regulator [Bosea lathyri]|uniref:Transcriptional regulator, LacI family n=1 Tax=Bosea lathyri TaxID=1036778 RepID=A0A1H5VI59_9HYPH|nr:LacI family DNA-binding transcriptional regulator [Bosea lathyri]SEF86924.1 transcriptional regulator, LacI family [Bosea lathyri]
MAAKIFDVAHRANVSVSTVSNYLNRRLERMAPATQARVQRAISELAFSPSRVARQLKTGQSDIIGLVVPSVANPFFGQLAMAIQTAAQARGYQTLLYNTRRDAGSELAIARELAAFGVRGLITGSAPLNEQHASALADCGLAVVAFDARARNLQDDRVDVVSLDNGAAMALAVGHLVELGHRRIVYVTAPTRTASRTGRLAGFQQAVALHGLEAEASIHEIMVAGDSHGDDMIAELGRSAAGNIAAINSRPTAVVAMNDILAIGLSAGFREVGLRIPDALSLVGIDDLFLASLGNPPLTTVRQPLGQMAEAAIESIVARLEGRSPGPRNYIFAPELVVRQSTAGPT